MQTSEIMVTTMVFVFLATTFPLSVMSTCTILNNMATDTIESSLTCQPPVTTSPLTQEEEALNSANSTHSEIKISANNIFALVQTAYDKIDVIT